LRFVVCSLTQLLREPLLGDRPSVMLACLAAADGLHGTGERPLSKEI